MEDEAQKMVALKKAYADIILNTAKEAAARIMASERKAVRFQQDLSYAKDEALRMLLGLKHMIDSKTKEVELTSLCQQRKIEELEAQLHEAEDVITDLRAELKQTWDQLEIMKKNQVQPLNGTSVEEGAAHDNLIPEPTQSHPSSSGPQTISSSIKDMLMNPRIRNKSYYEATDKLSVSQPETYYAHNSEIASMIMRSKEPGLCKNGCTHRIRAFERNLMDDKTPSFEDVDNQHAAIKNDLITEERERSEGLRSIPSSMTRRIEIMKNLHVGEIKKFQKLRRRTSRFGKSKTGGCRSCGSQLLKPCQASALISHRRTCLVGCDTRSDESRNTHSSCRDENMDITNGSCRLEGQIEHKTHCCECENKLIEDGRRARITKKSDSISNSPMSTKACGTFSCLANGVVKSGDDHTNMTENDKRMKPFPRLDPGLTLIKSDVDPISGSASVSISKASNRSILVESAVEKDKELMDEPVVKQENRASENLSSPSSQANLEMVITSVMNSDMIEEKVSEEVMDGSTFQVDHNRLLKYTFQRKRKKESSSISDALENSTLKRKSGEKHSGELEPKNSSLITESSRDSRRLAQVARQLISLSGKRW